jgi:hypothetical protein
VLAKLFLAQFGASSVGRGLQVVLAFLTTFGFVAQKEACAAFRRHRGWAVFAKRRRFQRGSVAAHVEVLVFLLEADGWGLVHFLGRPIVVVEKIQILNLCEAHWRLWLSKGVRRLRRTTAASTILSSRGFTTRLLNAGARCLEGCS